MWSEKSLVCLFTSPEPEIHNLGEEKIKPKYIKWSILKKYKHQYFYWKNVINSEYERLSKSSLTGVMKFILIKKAMLKTFVGKIKQEMFYWLWQFRPYTLINTGNNILSNTKYMPWWYGNLAQSPFSSVMFHNVIYFSMLLFILYYTNTTNTKKWEFNWTMLA